MSIYSGFLLSSLLPRATFGAFPSLDFATASLQACRAVFWDVRQACRALRKFCLVVCPT